MTEVHPLDGMVRPMARGYLFAQPGDVLVISNCQVNMQEAEDIAAVFRRLGIQCVIFDGEPRFGLVTKAQMDVLARELSDGEARSGSTGRPVSESGDAATAGGPDHQERQAATDRNGDGRDDRSPADSGRGYLVRDRRGS